MQGAAVQLLTVGVRAVRLNESIRRIEYVLRTHNLRPVGLAGNRRVYSADDLHRSTDELHRIDARKGGAG